MRLVVSMVVILLTAGSVQLAAEGKPDKSVPHVRPLQDDGRRLLAIGMARSETFQRLVTRLEQSDVFVYVDVTLDIPPHLAGVTRFLSSTKTSRFLIVRLDRMTRPAVLVGILGHELKHAVEVADAKDVTSAEALERLYRRIGVETGPEMYDTEAARQAGQDVRAEAAHGDRPIVQVANNRSPRGTPMIGWRDASGWVRHIIAAGEYLQTGGDRAGAACDTRTLHADPAARMARLRRRS